MGLDLICLLFVVGLAFMFAEPFIPAGGVLGVIGLILAGVSLFFGFRESLLLGFIQLGVGVAFAIVTVHLFFRRLAHTDQQEASPEAEEGTVELLGARGEALTPLRPSGMAMIKGRRVSVVTRGVLVDKGSHLVVAEVHGNRVVVEPLTEEGAPDQG